MKTIGTFLSALFLLLSPWCIVPASAQQPADNGDKKIVITKRTVDPDGTVTTETIVKKGKAAESFDADAYLKENEGANVDINIREEAEGGNYVRITTSDEEDDEDRLIEINWQEFNDAMNEVGTTMRNLGNDFNGMVFQSCDEKHGFLGVSQSDDEDEDDAPGMKISVVKGSGAEKAGLRDNDVILSLNDTKINRWDDLTQFMRHTKSGEQIQVNYQRDGAAATTTATLTESQSLLKVCQPNSSGFLGISPADEQDKGKGIAVNVIKETGAEAAGLQDGDRITHLNYTKVEDWEDIQDIISNTKVGDVIRVTFIRKGAAQTVNATLGEPKSQWDSFSNSDNWNINVDNDWSDNFNFDVREKPACLGVYSSSWSADNREGSKITDFTEESAARDASMQVGDVITRVNGQNVNSHEELWNEIAKYQPGDKVTVDFLRDNGPKTIEATLKACKDRSQVNVTTSDDNGHNVQRRFYAWSWGENEQQNMRTRRVITIRRASPEGDAAQPQAAPSQPVAQDRSLKLESFRAYPNPTAGPVTVEFRSEATPTVVTLLDLSGRQLFREELNAFNGEYNQQFDLNEYAKGTVIIQVQQGDKIFTEQIVVN